MTIVKQYLDKLHSEGLATYNTLKTIPDDLETFKLTVSDNTIFLKVIYLSKQAKIYLFEAQNDKPGYLFYEMEIGPDFTDRTYNVLKKQIGVGYKVPSAFFDNKVISKIVCFSLKKEILKIGCLNKEINQKMKTNAFWMNLYHCMYGYTGFEENEVDWRRLYLSKVG